MNKKQLRQRILDVAAGVGISVYHDDDLEMWEWYDDAAVDLMKLAQGLNRAFELKSDCSLVKMYHLDKYKDPQTLVDFFWTYRDEIN